MRVDLKTNVWRPLVRLAAKAAVGVALVAGAAVTIPATAQARDHGGGGNFSGHSNFGGHAGFAGHGGGHWGGGGRAFHGGYWRGGHYWGPSWGIGIGFPVYPAYYDPYYYDPYYYNRTVVVERPVAESSAWPVYNEQAYDQAMSAPLGQSVSWDDGNTSGSVTPVRDGKSDGRYCREFQQNIVIDGKRQQAFGAACQTPDGGWEIVPDNQ